MELPNLNPVFLCRKKKEKNYTRYGTVTRDGYVTCTHYIYKMHVYLQ